MTHGLAIAWLLFIRVTGPDPAPRQYGPFTSVSTCIEAATEMKRELGDKLKYTRCMAS